MTQYEDLIITKIMDAPVKQVWQAWTQKENLQQWWGPSGYEVEVKEFNLQPEGVFHYSMSAKGGPKMWGKFVYKEVEAPTRLVFINSFSDEEGNLLRAPFSATWPQEMHNVVTLQDIDGKTQLTLACRPYNANSEEEKTFADRHNSMQQAFGGTFAKLEEFLK